MDSFTELIFRHLKSVFYQAVPGQFKTYCALTSQIAANVLRRFGLAAEALPCQLSFANGSNVILIGFIESAPPQQWNGHAICIGDGFLIDTATSHLQKYSDGVPDCLYTKLAPWYSSAIAGFTLDKRVGKVLWWLPPPKGFDTTPPQEPPAVVEKFADRLCAELEQSLAKDPQYLERNQLAPSRK